MIQLVSGPFISWISEHPSNARGLSIHEIYKILNGIGLKQIITEVHR